MNGILMKTAGDIASCFFILLQCETDRYGRSRGLAQSRLRALVFVLFHLRLLCYKFSN